MSDMWRSYTDKQLGKDDDWHEVPDPVNHPTHYKSHPSGVEAIQITEHENFCIGSVFKYLLRRKYKGKELQDLKKARWYLDKEIERLEECE